MRPYDNSRVWRKYTRQLRRGRARSIRPVRTQHQHRWVLGGDCFHQNCTARAPWVALADQILDNAVGGI